MQRTILFVEQDLELVGEVVVERAVHALHRLLLRQLAVHPRAPATPATRYTPPATRHTPHDTRHPHAHAACRHTKQTQPNRQRISGSSDFDVQT